MIELAELQKILDAEEDEHLEFKEAKQQYDSVKLIEYCVALANEGGGRLILGVTDSRPRKVVGTRAFSDLERIKLNCSRMRRTNYRYLHVRLDPLLCRRLHTGLRCRALLPCADTL